MNSSGFIWLHHSSVKITVQIWTCRDLPWCWWGLMWTGSLGSSGTRTFFYRLKRAWRKFLLEPGIRSWSPAACYGDSWSPNKHPNWLCALPSEPDSQCLCVMKRGIQPSLQDWRVCSESPRNLEDTGLKRISLILDWSMLQDSFNRKDRPNSMSHELQSRIFSSSGIAIRTIKPKLSLSVLLKEWLILRTFEEPFKHL